jgi:hypothetical protein
MQRLTVDFGIPRARPAAEKLSSAATFSNTLRSLRSVNLRVPL